MWLLFEASIWLAVLFERRQGKDRPGLGYSGRLMARAAVKAKQQAAKAQAQPSKARKRGRRKHSGGGNPNQDLFFMRLRRQAEVGVPRARDHLRGRLRRRSASAPATAAACSSSTTASSAAAAPARSRRRRTRSRRIPAKGYRDLATAYEHEEQPRRRPSPRCTSYLALKKTDADSWARARRHSSCRGRQTYATQYQQAQQAAQARGPERPVPARRHARDRGGPEPGLLGRARSRLRARPRLLYQNAIGAFGQAVTDYQTASKLRPAQRRRSSRSSRPRRENAGNNKVAVEALRRYLKLYPNAPQTEADRGRRSERAAPRARRRSARATAAASRYDDCGFGRADRLTLERPAGPANDFRGIRA